MLRRRRLDGQGLVEFSIMVPVFIFLLLGVLEFGLAFTHNMTIEYASREGARTGAELGAGNAVAGGPNVACANVDKEIIAAVQRVLSASGSQIAIGNVTEIRIYKAGTDGQQDSSNPNAYNIWTNGGTTSYNGATLNFTNTTSNWSACSRQTYSTQVSGTMVPPDSLGVRITYNYRLATPLGLFLNLGNNATFLMTDRTVMALNPPNAVN